MVLNPDWVVVGESVEDVVGEEKCRWILSSRWRGLVGLPGAGAPGRCWLASVTKLCLHGADLELNKDNCRRASTRRAMLSLSSDREQLMQMVFIRESARSMAGRAPVVQTEV